MLLNVKYSFNRISLNVYLLHNVRSTSLFTRKFTWILTNGWIKTLNGHVSSTFIIKQAVSLLFTIRYRGIVATRTIYWFCVVLSFFFFAPDEVTPVGVPSLFPPVYLQSTRASGCSFFSHWPYSPLESWLLIF
jgi:hypothetical protein